MSYDSKHFCKTPRCMERIEKYGPDYHRVWDDFYHTFAIIHEDLISKCDSCGGYLNKNLEWIHKCSTCGKDVNPGELVGLFVPHNCQECQRQKIENDKKTGNVCRLCGSPRSICCC